MKKNDILRYSIKSVISLLTLGLIYWFYWITCPALNIGFFGSYIFIASSLALVIANVCMWISSRKADRIITFPIWIFILICIVILVIVKIIPLFHADTKQKQLGQVEKIEYNQMIEEIDMAQIPIVDKKLAKKQADKKIGQDPALGSRVKLGDGAIQNVNGEILYVFPLEHTGYFKWKAHRSTPGYITVSASNPNKVEYVTQLDGNPINVFYSQSSCFSYNLTRHIRNQGYNCGLTEYTFEIDDSGRPFWVVTAYHNTIAWSTPEADGVIIVDAQSGETKYYPVNDTPSWVDIIQPSAFIEDQIDNWGILIHGYFNISGSDKIQKTNLLLTVYVDGECYYFTGMTSVGSDDSCVGFIMVNTRNKKAKMAYMAGATEDAAMHSAEGLVANFGYKSTEPLPLNVCGIPTYVMALKDNEGLIKYYSMVNIDNYSIASKGVSLLECQKNYMQTVAKNSTTYVVGSNEAYGYDLEGTVKRISSEVQEGSTQYFLVVEEKPDILFTCSYSVSEELAITQIGDTIKISYIDDSNGTTDIISFDNIKFAVQKSEDQEKRDELDEGVSSLDSPKNEIYNVSEENDKFWDELTEEEKTKMINNFKNKNN